MNTCIYTRRTFENASGEHILQNSLGARWTDSTIVCDDIQQKFGDTIDVAVANSLNGFRTLLGTLGGRGGPPPPIKNVEDQQGNSYHLTSGGQPALARPVVEVNFQEDGTAEVHIQLGNKNQLGWALHILNEQYPNLIIDPEAFTQSAENSKDYLDLPLHLQFGIGGPEFFRGILKAVFNLLGATHRDVSLSSRLDALRSFIVNGNGNSERFVGWPTAHTPLPLPQLGTHDHFLAVWSREGTVGGFIQLFGEFPFVFRFGVEVDCEDFCTSYLVNSHRDTDPSEIRNHDFDPACLPEFDHCPHLPGSDVWEAHRVRTERFLCGYQRRAEATVIHDIVEEVLGSKEKGEIITHEDIDDIQERIMRFVKFKLGVKET